MNFIISFLLVITALQLTNSATIIYVQENQVSGSTIKTNTISGFPNSPSSPSSQYTVSLWIKQSSMSSTTGTQYNYVSLTNPSNVKVIQIGGAVGNSGIFSVYSTGDAIGYWNFENLNIEGQLQTSKWTFVALSVDVTNSLAYGIRYRLDSSYTVLNVFNQMASVGNFYQIDSATTISWLGAAGVTCSCTQTYVRLFIDYAASSNDAMVNLALLNPQSVLYHLTFQSDPSVNNNQTFPAEYFTNVTQGALTGVIGTSQSDTVNDSELGDINILRCRPGTAMSLTSPEVLPDGIVIMMDIYPYSSYTNNQMLFTLRDTQQNNLVLRALFNPSTGLITLQQDSNPSWLTVLTTTAPLPTDTWSRIIFEVVPALPIELVGYFSARIWINSVVTPRAYFGTYPNQSNTFFKVSQYMVLDLCSTKQKGNPNQDTTLNAYFDLTNVLWFRGAEALFSDEADPTCLLSGFLAPNQATCFLCRPSYIYSKGKCVSECPSSSLSDSTTNSCQSCGQSLYFTAQGQCTDCTSDGFGISGSECVECDPSCMQCNGDSATDCTLCYPGAYYYSQNNSCGACNVDGYYISGSNCDQCHSSCLTCNGPSATDCMTCLPGTYYYSQNNTCLACDVDGFYISGTNCNQCHSSCLACSGPASTDCTTCASGMYYHSQNNTCLACDVDGFYISGSNCNQCDSSCSTCNGPSSTDCTTYSLGTYYYSQNSSCLACNIDGYYISGTNCNECHTSCLACNGPSSTDCTTCYPGTYLISQNNSCGACNVDGYYISGTNCNQCHSDCLACSGPSSTDCTACSPGTYFYSQNNSCLACDIDGYYISGTECHQCHSSCLTCSGPSSTDCTSTCSPGTYYYSQNSSCLACNVDGYYISGTNCNECHTSCLACNGPSSTDCTTCASGMYYYSQNNSCLACDVDGFYISGSNCNQCHSSCLTCSGSTSTDCLSCPFDETLSNGSCVNDSSSAIANAVTASAIPAVVITQASSIGSSALQIQTAATSILPILLGGASTTAVLLVGFVSDILIYRFINVPFSAAFKEFASRLYSNFIPNPYNGLQDQYNISKSNIGKFKEFGMSSVMLGNSGNSLDREAYALAMIIFSLVGMYSFKKYEKIASVFMKIRNTFMWNVFLTYYIGDLPEFVLFSMVQLRENDCKGAYPAYACSVSISILVSYVILLPFFAYLLNRKPKASPLSEKAQKGIFPETALNTPRAGDSSIVNGLSDRVNPEGETARNPINLLENEKKSSLPRWAPIPSSMTMMIEDIKQNNRFNRNFMLIMQARNLIIVFSVFFLQDYGTTQAAIYVVIEIIYELLILVIFRSFQKKIQMFLFGVNQSCKVLIGILALYIGAASPLPDDSNDKFGLAIIGITLSAIVINGIIAIVTLLKDIFTLFKSCQRRYFKKNNSVMPQPKKEPDSPSTVSLHIQSNRRTSISLDGSAQADRESILLPKSRFAPSSMIKVDDLAAHEDHSHDLSIIPSPQVLPRKLDRRRLVVNTDRRLPFGMKIHDFSPKLHISLDSSPGLMNQSADNKHSSSNELIEKAEKGERTPSFKKEKFEPGEI